MLRNPFRIVHCTVAVLVLCLAPFSQPAGAAVAAGTVRGTVTGPDAKPMGGVALVLRNDITGFHADARTDHDGKFAFFNVPFNPYELHVEVQGFQTQHLKLDVRSTAPVEIPVALALQGVSEKVSVEAEQPAAVLETDSSQSHVDIDKSFIEHAPAASPSRGMEALVVQTPGFAQDENGRYHFQGAHSEQSYVVDGQPISDQIGITFSNSIDPRILQSAEVIYGNVPAEYGEKIAAVINLTTKSGLGDGRDQRRRARRRGSIQHLRRGRFRGRRLFPLRLLLLRRRIEVGPIPRSSELRQPATIMATRSGSFSAWIMANENSTNSFRVSGLVGRTRRDVPNTFTQQATDTDNQVETNDWNANLGWQRVFSPSIVLDTTVFARNNRYTYEGSPNDPSRHRELEAFSGQLRNPARPDDFKPVRRTSSRPGPS